MSTDYIVKGRSNVELRNIANALRKSLGLDRVKVVDIVECLTSGWVETIGGKKRLVVEIVADADIGGDDAISISEKYRAIIKIKKTVWEFATPLFHLGSVSPSHLRARFTLAHEYFHVVLCHDRAPMARSTGVNISTVRPSFIPPYESAEHQANEAAAAFLINFEFARQYRSAGELSREFSVSVQAAEMFLRKSLSVKKSEIVSVGLRALGEFLRSTKRGDICPTCGLETNVPLTGNRTSCGNCQRTGDAYQDGDSREMFGIEF
jgi:hypothetical protein